MSDSTKFGLSDSSSSSASSGIPILTAEELGKVMSLNNKVVDFLKKDFVDEKEVLLIFSYDNPFFNLEGNYAANKAAVSNSLVLSGGINVDGDVFKFADWLALHAARDQLFTTMPWLFYDPTGILLYRQNNEVIKFIQQQTIYSTVVTRFAEQTGKHTIIAYEFFRA